MKYFKMVYFPILVTFLLSSQLINAKEIPKLTGPVIDETGTLSPSTKASFESLLKNFRKKHGPQVQLYITDSLEGESIEGHSIKVVDQWKLGDKKKDDGVLFLIALKDRKMRIEVGQGLEGSLTDLKAGRIIDHLKAYFKKGQYEKGIYIGLGFIIKVLGGEIKEIPKVSRRRAHRNSAEMPLKDFLPLIFMVLFIIISSFRRNRFSYFGSHYSGGFSGGSFSGGGFSSGGSWGGGGGGFSGGGASGGW